MITLLLSAPRCGSQLLTDFLESHPGITAIHEPYQRLHPQSSPLGYLEGARDVCRTEALVVGIRYNQYLDLSDLQDRFPVIHLTRENKELLAASQILAGTQGKLPIKVSRQTFGKKIAYCTKEEHTMGTRIVRGLSPHHSITYEEITGGKEVTRFKDVKVRKALLKFIGVKDATLVTAFQKEHSAPLDSLLTLTA